MYTEEQLSQLEQDERSLTEEEILAILLLLRSTKLNLEKELLSFYQKYGKDGVVTYREARKWVGEQDHRRRLVVLLLFIKDEFKSLVESVIPHFESIAKGVMLRESEFFDVDIEDDSLICPDWGADDSNWLERLENDASIWEYYLLYDIRQSLFRRNTINDLLTRLDSRFDTMEGVIKRLALTESTAIGSLTRREIFKELGITKYQFFTRADERTCETCGSMHGLIFPISAYQVGVTASPLHPSCRCWEVPIRE